MVKESISLSGVAFACYVFPAFETNYRDAYSRFLDNVNHALNMRSEGHRKFLLIWLNEWGCRQFELVSHAEISIKITAWFVKYENILPHPTKSLLGLSDVEIATAAEIYDRLAEIVHVFDRRQASWSYRRFKNTFRS